MKGRKQERIKKLGEMERCAVNIQGAAQEDILGQLQVEELVIVGDGRFRKD